MYSFLGKTKVKCDEVLCVTKDTLKYIVKFKNGTEITIPSYEVTETQLKSSEKRKTKHNNIEYILQRTYSIFFHINILYNAKVLTLC